MDETERLVTLAVIQKKLQKLWNRIEYRELTGTYAQQLSPEITEQLWQEFEELEKEEAKYLRPGRKRQ